MVEAGWVLWYLVDSDPTAANPALTCHVHLGKMPKLASSLTLWSIYSTTWPPTCQGRVVVLVQPACSSPRPPGSLPPLPGIPVVHSTLRLFWSLPDGGPAGKPTASPVSFLSPWFYPSSTALCKMLLSINLFVCLSYYFPL